MIFQKLSLFYFDKLVVDDYSFNHQDYISVYYIPPYTLLLYSKIGVCRGIPIFLIFLPNIDCGYSQSMFVLSKFSIFTALKISVYLHGYVFVIVIMMK